MSIRSSQKVKKILEVKTYLRLVDSVMLFLFKENVGDNNKFKICMMLWKPFFVMRKMNDVTVNTCMSYLAYLKHGVLGFLNEWNNTKNKNATMSEQFHKKSLKIPKVVIRICKSKVRQHNGQKKKDKQQSTKHSTEN